jgi:hypothetical protein
VVTGTRGAVLAGPRDLAVHASGNVTHTRTGLKVGTITRSGGLVHATHADGTKMAPARTAATALDRLASYHNAQLRKRPPAAATPASAGTPAAAAGLGPVGKRAHARLLAKGVPARRARATAARAESMVMTGKPS